MATDQRNLPGYFNTNSDFQSWCQGVHAQIVAAGWTQTADSGQINNTTVSKPAGTNTSQGYEIWRNSTSDIYFKLEYGSGAPSATCPGIWLTPGTGSNGSGTITGPASATLARSTLQANFQGQVAGGTLPSYCSGDGTYLTILSNVDTTGFSLSYPQTLWGFIIDKIRDASGAVTGEGFVVIGWNGGDGNTRYWSVVGNAVLANNTGNSTGPFQGPTDNVVSSAYAVGVGSRSYQGNELVMSPIIGVGQMRFLKACVFYNGLDFGSGEATTFTATALGGSHTYMAHPIITMYTQQLSATWRAPCHATGDNWALLWE